MEVRVAKEDARKNGGSNAALPVTANGGTALAPLDTALSTCSRPRRKILRVLYPLGAALLGGWTAMLCEVADPPRTPQTAPDRRMSPRPRPSDANLAPQTQTPPMIQ